MVKPEDLKILKLFKEKAERIRKSKFAKKVFEEKAELSLKAKENKSVEISMKAPIQDDIDVLILTIRFFIQDNEPTSIKNMEGLYNQLPIEKKYKEYFKTARRKLNKILDSPSNMKLNYNGKILACKEILDIFIYGGLAHANPSKKEIFDDWMKDRLQAYFFQMEFIFILTDVINFIMYFQNLNEFVIIVPNLTIMTKECRNKFLYP